MAYNSDLLQFVFDALVRINDRQELHSSDTAEDLQDIQHAVERLRQPELLAVEDGL